MKSQGYIISSVVLIFVCSCVFNVWGQRPPLKAIPNLDEIEVENLLIARCIKGGQDDDITHINRGGKLLIELFGLVATAKGTLQMRDDASTIIYSDEKNSLNKFRKVFLTIDDLSKKMSQDKEVGCVRLERYRVFVKEID